jgi:hypothetical protein
MQQVQPEAWNKWNTRCRDTLIHMQKRGGAGDGSWENSRWNDRGGRIFTTSLATLTLEVYYRYLPLNPDAPEVDDGRRAADKKIQHGWEREQAPRQRNRAEPN